MVMKEEATGTEGRHVEIRKPSFPQHVPYSFELPCVRFCPVPRPGLGAVHIQSTTTNHSGGEALLQGRKQATRGQGAYVARTRQGLGFSQSSLSGFLPTHQTLRLNQRGLQRHKSEH